MVDRRRNICVWYLNASEDAYLIIDTQNNIHCISYTHNFCITWCWATSQHEKNPKGIHLSSYKSVRYYLRWKIIQYNMTKERKSDAFRTLLRVLIEFIFAFYYSWDMFTTLLPPFLFFFFVNRTQRLVWLHKGVRKYLQYRMHQIYIFLGYDGVIRVRTDCHVIRTCHCLFFFFQLIKSPSIFKPRHFEKCVKAE